MRVLEVSLRKAGFTVTTAVSVQDASDKLELDTPDLIISETTFPDGDGFELRRRVRTRGEWEEIPFIFLTAEAAIENKIRGLELGVDDYLTKPIYIKEIVTRINILLQKRQRVRFEERRDGRTRFAGRVADMPVVDVIQTIEISRKSGVIQFVGERNRQAAIYFRDGRVIDAEAGALQGEDAVYRLLTWSEGDFEVVFRTVRRREVIGTSSQGLLMEGMRRLDEWSRLLEQLPPLSHRFEVDAGELSVRLGDVPDDNNPILRLIDGRRTLLEVIDSSDVGDLECLQAISRLYFEEMLIDLDHGAPVRAPTGKPAPLVEVEVPTPIEEVASGPIELGEQEVEEEDIAAEELPLQGSYRPSSLRLIDEAVAAAQAIEPALFADEVSPENKPAKPFTKVMDAVSAAELIPPPHPKEIEIRNSDPQIFEVGEVEMIDDANVSLVMDTSLPEPIEARRVTAADAHKLGRDESGLRMIGSLGRDRAEASGELAMPGSLTPHRATTERELVTILPRRITREMAVVAPPVEKVASAPPVEVPIRPPPPKLILAGGVVRQSAGPSRGAIALLALAGVLGVIAVYLYVTRPVKKSTRPPIDASEVGPVVTPDAAQLDVDAAPAAVDAVVATADARAVTVDASGPAIDAVGRGSAKLPDYVTEAKQLHDQAFTALQESNFDRALQLVEQSLKLRRTARSYLLRAQALQRLGRVDEALTSLQQAEDTFAIPPIFEMRARILKAAGRNDEAKVAIEKYLSMVGDKGPTVKLFKQWLEELR